MPSVSPAHLQSAPPGEVVESSAPVNPSQVPTGGIAAGPSSGDGSVDNSASALNAFIIEDHPTDEAPPPYASAAPQSSLAQGRLLPPAPTYSASVEQGHRSTNPEAGPSQPRTSPSGFRQFASTGSLRRRANISGSSAGSVPPVPQLPSGDRGATSMRLASVPGESNSNEAQAEAGTSSRPAGSSLQISGQKKQSDSNHKLREYVKTNDENSKNNDAIIRRLTEKNADPTAPSSKAEENTFHKLAKNPNNNRTIINHVFSAAENSSSIGPGRVSQAAIKQNKDGNTPIHLAEYQRGVSDAGNRQSHAVRAAHLNGRLRTAANLNGHPVDSIKNNKGLTPNQMYEEGRRVMQETMQNDQRAQDNLRQVGLV